MKKRRVLLIGPLPPPIGGDTVMTLNLLNSRYWDECGIEIGRINTSAGDRVRLYEERLSLGDLLRGLKVLAFLLVKLPRVDAVLLWANSRFICTAGLAIIVMSDLFGTPLIVKLFGTSLVQRIEECGSLRRRLTASMLGKVTFLLAETGDFARWLVKDVGVSESRVVWVPNLLPDETFREHFVKKRFSGKCIFVGQVKREKGIFDIIEALRDRSDLKCDFYGQLVDRDRHLFLSEIERWSNLSYNGVIKPGEVCEVISGYEALLLPTYHGGEGYPAVILEAFAAGVPVVTTRWKSLPEIVEDGVRGLLVPVKSPKMIQEALDRFSADQELYDSIAKNSFEYVRSFSEREIIRNRLIMMIKEIWGDTATIG